MSVPKGYWLSSQPPGVATTNWDAFRDRRVKPEHICKHCGSDLPLAPSGTRRNGAVTVYECGCGRERWVVDLGRAA